MNVLQEELDRAEDQLLRVALAEAGRRRAGMEAAPAGPAPLRSRRHRSMAAAALAMLGTAAVLGVWASRPRGPVPAPAESGSAMQDPSRAVRGLEYVLVEARRGMALSDSGTRFVRARIPVERGRASFAFVDDLALLERLTILESRRGASLFGEVVPLDGELLAPLASCASLRSLDVQSVRGFDIDLLRPLAQSSLRALSLSGSVLTGALPVSLRQVAAWFPDLTSLSLRGVNVREIDGLASFSALRDFACRDVRGLDLSTVCTALPTTVESLVLSRSNLAMTEWMRGEESGPELQLDESLQRLQGRMHLRFLDLSGWAMSPDRVRALPRSVESLVWRQAGCADPEIVPALLSLPALNSFSTTFFDPALLGELLRRRLFRELRIPSFALTPGIAELIEDQHLLRSLAVQITATAGTDLSTALGFVPRLPLLESLELTCEGDRLGASAEARALLAPVAAARRLRLLTVRSFYRAVDLRAAAIGRENPQLEVRLP